MTSSIRSEPILLCCSAELGRSGRSEKETTAAEISIRAIINMQIGDCPLFLFPAEPE